MTLLAFYIKIDYTLLINTNLPFQNTWLFFYPKSSLPDLQGPYYGEGCSLLNLPFSVEKIHVIVFFFFLIQIMLQFNNLAG